MLRKDELCPGAGECPEVLSLDPWAGSDALPCEGCPLDRLNRYLESGDGRRIMAALEIDWAIKCGLAVSLKDLNHLEFLVLRQLHEERQKYEIEQQERQRQKMEHGSRMRHTHRGR